MEVHLFISLCAQGFQETLERARILHLAHGVGNHVTEILPAKGTNRVSSEDTLPHPHSVTEAIPVKSRKGLVM